MIYIAAGLILWTLAHGLKRLFPRQRAAMGDRGKGVVALGLLISIVLMVVGYKTDDGLVLWSAPEWFYPINNVLMLIALYLFAVSGARTRLARVIRHPMLMGMMVWATAHILVNGDTPSLLLFGGLFAWARFTVYLIDRSDMWEPPTPGSIGKEVGVAVVVILIYVGVIHIHDLLGPYPFWWGWPVGDALAPILSPIF